MEFSDVLGMRRSTRAFTGEPVADKQLEAILDAAQRAPLAMGDRATSHLTVVRPGDLMERIRAACMLRRKDGTEVDPFYGASTIVFFSAADISDDHIEFCNAGCVIENMCLAATNLGLGSCYIWGCLRKLRNNPEALALLGLPEGYEILSAFVCGHPVEPLAERSLDTRISADVLEG